MEKLLTFLKNIPEYTQLLDGVKRGRAAAVTGVGQINRSHLIAGLYSHTNRPVVVICQDDMTAKRMGQELGAFLGFTPQSLPSRDLTFYDTAVVSRSWEHRRLQQLHALANGETRLQLLTWESLSMRTIPPETLKQATFSLTVGEELPQNVLLDRLLCAGYTRCHMVEGPGQFAVRGDIVDIFSPASVQPVRAEFFGDELDTMGYFDPATQRRVENVDSVVILPVAETQPMLHSGGVAGLCKDITSLISRQKRRKTPHEPLIKTLTQDYEKFSQGISHSAADRYMALIYPEMATAMDYIPSDAIIVLCDQNNLHRTARSRTDEMAMGLDSMLQSGILCGELCDFVCQWEDFTEKLRNRCVVYVDAFAGSSYPTDCPPKLLLPMTAKQLPGYGGNLDTAAADLAHYQRQEFSALVLCGSR